MSPRPICIITATAQAAQDKAAKDALRRAQASGSVDKLRQIEQHAQAQLVGQSSVPVGDTPPPILTKRHDLIAYYRKQGLSETVIVEKMSQRGFAIKVADVRANAKHYGTDKIPAHAYFTTTSPVVEALPAVQEMKKKGTQALINGSVKFSPEGKLTEAQVDYTINGRPVNPKVSAAEINNAFVEAGISMSPEEIMRRTINIPDEWRMEKATMSKKGNTISISAAIVEEREALSSGLAQVTNKVGSISRTYDLAAKTVYHDIFMIDPKMQGGGLAKRILAAEMDLYRELGFKVVKMEANIDVGGYAWARYGFVPDQAGWDVTRRWIKNRLANGMPTPGMDRVAVRQPGEATHQFVNIKSADLTFIKSRASVDELNRLLDNPDPKTIRLLAAHPMGKTLLLGSKWSGSFDLSDPLSRQLFEHYVGR